jgi:hypothetical protein
VDRGRCHSRGGCPGLGDVWQGHKNIDRRWRGNQAGPGVAAGRYLEQCAVPDGAA